MTVHEDGTLKGTLDEASDGKSYTWTGQRPAPPPPGRKMPGQAIKPVSLRRKTISWVVARQSLRLRRTRAARPVRLSNRRRPPVLPAPGRCATRAARVHPDAARSRRQSDRHIPHARPAEEFRQAVRPNHRRRRDGLHLRAAEDCVSVAKGGCGFPATRSKANSTSRAVGTTFPGAAFAQPAGSNDGASRIGELRGQCCAVAWNG